MLRGSIFWVKLLIVGNLSSCYNLSKHTVKMLRMQIVISASDRSSTLADLRLILFTSIAEILTSNSVGTQLFFLGCNQDNIGGSNFITKKKICLVLPEKEISNHKN